MDDDEFEDEVTEFTSVRWSWLVATVHVFDVVANVLRTVADGIQELNLMVAHHHNWNFDRREFAEEARAEIESIPTQEG